MAKFRCKECDFLNPEGAKYCGNCSSQLNKYESQTNSNYYYQESIKPSINVWWIKVPLIFGGLGFLFGLMVGGISGSIILFFMMFVPIFIVCFMLRLLIGG